MRLDLEFPSGRPIFELNIFLISCFLIPDLIFEEWKELVPSLIVW